MRYIIFIAVFLAFVASTSASTVNPRPYILSLSVRFNSLSSYSTWVTFNYIWIVSRSPLLLFHLLLLSHDIRSYAPFPHVDICMHSTLSLLFPHNSPQFTPHMHAFSLPSLFSLSHTRSLFLSLILILTLSLYLHLPSYSSHNNIGL